MIVYCVSCHGPTESKGKITLHDLDGGQLAGHAMERLEKILKELKSGEMPPEDEEQPEDADRNAVIAWIKSGMRTSSSSVGEAATAPTARRLTNFEYQNTMRDLIGFELKFINNLPQDPVKPYRFNNTAEFMLIGLEQMERYLECARRAMASAIVDPGEPEIHRTEIVRDPTTSQIGGKSDEIGVSNLELGLGVKSWPKTGEFRVCVKAAAILPAGFKEATMRETLAMVLVSPQFLYHTVSQDDVAWRQYELASKLSYFLWGSMPDDELMTLAVTGKLDDPKVIQEQVRRLLADNRSHGFVDNFATQWLSITKMKSVSINRDLFPRFLYTVHVGERLGQEVSFRPAIRDSMHDETIGFIEELIKRNVSVVTILDSDFAYLNQPLAAHYGVAGVEGNQLRPVAIKPEHHLGGLLTQGSVWVGNSTGSAPHPIYRVVWLREAILGEDVKPPPAEVPALSDSVGDAAANAITIKDLLHQHRKQESCNVCHASLDPWGIPFEKYNVTGSFQPFVPQDAASRGRPAIRSFNEAIDKDLTGYAAYLKTINTVAVDATARVPRGPMIDGMEELKAFLLEERKDEIGENVLRRLLSYGIGRGLTFRDLSAVEKLCEQAKANDYLFQDMIIAICQSEVFLGRSAIKGVKECRKPCD